MNKEEISEMMERQHEMMFRRWGLVSEDEYNEMKKKAEELAEGWQVIVFIPSKEEDADRITCGNALLSVKE